MIKHNRSIDQTFQALGHPTRRSIVELLVKRPHRASDLAAATGVTRSRMSKHLKVLLEAGIAWDERPPADARARVFHLRPEVIDDVQRWLDELQREWNRQLLSFKRYAERQEEQ